MSIRWFILLIAFTPACGGADTGDIARGAIQSQSSETLILNTSPCASEPSPMKFRAPWKLKALGMKTCERSSKTYQEYEVEQLATEDKPGDSGGKAGANEKKNPDNKPDGSGKKAGPNDKKPDEKPPGTGPKPATNGEKKDEGTPPSQKKPSTPESRQ